MNKTIEKSVAVNEASIGRLAYQLWEKASRPAGRDLEFWLAAEEQLRAAEKPAAASSSAEVPSAASSNDKAHKAPRIARGGIRKTWPKPYPSLPRF